MIRTLPFQLWPVKISPADSDTYRLKFGLDEGPDEDQ